MGEHKTKMYSSREADTDGGIRSFPAGGAIDLAKIEPILAFLSSVFRHMFLILSRFSFFPRFVSLGNPRRAEPEINAEFLYARFSGDSPDWNKKLIERLEVSERMHKRRKRFSRVLEAPVG